MQRVPNNPKGIANHIKGLCTLRVVYDFNWAWIAFYAYFLAYGYYGALAPSFQQYKTDLPSYTGQLFMLLGFQIALGLNAWKNAAIFKDSLTVTARDLFVFISFAILLLIFSYDRIQFSLFSDELSYAGSAHGHATYLAMLAARHFPVLDEYGFKYLVQAISLMLMVAVTVLFYASGRWAPKIRITIFVALLVLCRLIFAIKGGNGSPHPPLHLIPPFVFGALTGISDISFKLSYYLAYITFLTLLCKMLERKFPETIACLVTLAIGTIPLLSNLSTVVEHSFWSFVCFGLVFVELVTSPRPHFTRLVGLISIMTLMRQPSFLALLPVSFLYIVAAYRLGSVKQKIREFALPLSLVLLFLPFLATSLMHGTPSTLPLEQGSNFNRVSQAIGDGIVWDSVNSAISLWWIIFIPFSFVPLQRKYWSMNIAFLLFFVVAIYIYYSIHPGLWGFAKYQAEYAAPLAISGFLLFIKTVADLIVHQFVLLPCLAILIGLNAIKLKESYDLSYMQGPFFDAAEGRGGDEFDLLKSGLTAIPYEYKSAYAYIRQKGLSENTFSIGATYGVLPEIMNGYTSREVIASYDIYVAKKKIMIGTDAFKIDANMVESDAHIKAIIIGPVDNKQELVSNLKGRGWRNVADFRNARYGTSLMIMERP